MTVRDSSAWGIGAGSKAVSAKMGIPLQPRTNKAPRRNSHYHYCSANAVDRQPEDGYFGKVDVGGGGLVRDAFRWARGQKSRFAAQTSSYLRSQSHANGHVRERQFDLPWPSPSVIYKYAEVEKLLDKFFAIDETQSELMRF